MCASGLARCPLAACGQPPDRTGAAADKDTGRFVRHCQRRTDSIANGLGQCSDLMLWAAWTDCWCCGDMRVADRCNRVDNKTNATSGRQASRTGCAVLQTSNKGHTACLGMMHEMLRFSDLFLSCNHLTTQTQVLTSPSSVMRAV